MSEQITGTGRQFIQTSKCFGAAFAKERSG